MIIIAGVRVKTPEHLNKGLQTLYDKGPHRLLQASSREREWTSSSKWDT